ACRAWEITSTGLRQKGCGGSTDAPLIAVKCHCFCTSAAQFVTMRRPARQERSRPPVANRLLLALCAFRFSYRQTYEHYEDDQFYAGRHPGEVPARPQSVHRRGKDR